MIRRAAVALSAGTVFGAGLAWSGMTDPQRVHAFLDVGGAWDPTLGFVMAGALAPMALAWRVRRLLARPLVAPAFAVQAPAPLDGKLLGGAAVFGVGWGLSGLCPGPAIANLALDPLPAALFAAAMLGGMALERWLRHVGARPPVPVGRAGEGSAKIGAPGGLAPLLRAAAPRAAVGSAGSPFAEDV